jgi:archaellin
MTRLFAWRIGIACFASVVLFAATGAAQQKSSATPQQRLSMYDRARELSVQGSVISYAENSTVAPLGPRVLLQTASGTLDVHLGNAALLQSNHFTLATGDSVRVIGENVAIGSTTQFLARLIQKGNQAILLRSPNGFPLRPTASSAKSAGQKGVL